MAYKKTKKAVSVVTDTEHGKLITWVNESDDSAETTGTRSLAEKCRAYYDSDQWTDAEKQKLANQKQAATVINRCKPKVDALMGMERANRTTAKAHPRTPKETGGAEAATEAVRFCLQDNMFERARSDAWENMLIEGTGGIEVIVKPKDDSYKVIIRQIMWDRLIWDPHSRRKDFSDSRYLGQVVWMDYDEAVALYPDAKDVLEDMQSGSTTWDDKPRWMDNTRRRVKIVELYYRKDDGDWWYACFTRGGWCHAPKVSPYKNEEGETEHAYEFASLFVDREGGRYGSLRQVLDVQDEINKRRSKALHLMSVRQTFGSAGAVPDVNKARKELAKPDGHVEIAYGELNKDFGVLPTGDMAQAQFNLLTEAKMEMDLVGANSATQGKDKTVQSGVALRQRELTGQTELAPMFDMLKNLDIRVYRKTWNRIKQYWKAEMWLRVTDDENNLKFVGLNKPMTQGEMMLKQAQEQGAPPEQLQAMQQQIAQDPNMQQVVSTENDIVNMDVDIVMDDAPDTVTQEVEDFQAMAEMVKSGFPIPPEAVIMASPLSNKDKIIKMMKEQPQIPPQMQKQMEQMQEQLQKAGEEIQSLQQENLGLKHDTTADQMKVQADRETEQKKADIKKEQLQAEFALKQEAQGRDAQLAHAKALDEFQLKKELALMEHELEKEMADKAHSLEKEMADKKHALEKESADQKQSLDTETATNDHKLAKEKLALEQKAKTEVADEAGVEAVAPKLIESMQSIVKEFAEVIKGQQEFQKKLVEQLSKPKTVTLGSIKRTDGLMTGASATVQ